MKITLSLNIHLHGRCEHEELVSCSVTATVEAHI